MTKPSAISERIGDDALKAKTGRTWTQWIRLLDRAHALDKPHKEIAGYLRHTHSLSGWWSQMITVGYEQAKGMRVKHQKRAGFEISVSKTLAVSASDAFKAWSSPRSRQGFLNEPLRVRTANPPKSLRFNREDGTIIEIRIHPKGADKCQVAIQHFKLRSSTVAESAKKHWKAVLEALAMRL